MARKIYNQNFQHASCEKGSEYNYLIRTMMRKVKLKKNEAKAKESYSAGWGELSKPVIITFQCGDSCKD